MPGQKQGHIRGLCPPSLFHLVSANLFCIEKHIQLLGLRKLIFKEREPG